MDFSDGIGVHAYIHLLISLLQGSATRTGDLFGQAQECISQVRCHIDEMSPGSVIRVLDCFDLVHRIVYGLPVSRCFLNDHYMRVFDARIHGDRSVSDSELGGAISRRLRCGENVFFGRPLAWYAMSLEEWYESECHGTAARVKPHEMVRRAALLFHEDLSAIDCCQEKFKTALGESYRPKFRNLGEADGPTLVSLLTMLHNGCRFLSLPDVGMVEREIRQHLVCRTDVHPLDREAYAIDIINDKALAV